MLIGDHDPQIDIAEFVGLAASLRADQSGRDNALIPLQQRDRTL